jgi:predicted nucleotidyltransferase
LRKWGRTLAGFLFTFIAMKRLTQHNNEITRLCKAHHVKALYAFGSVLTDDFNEKSDVDLIVDFEPIALEKYADNYFDLKFSLQDILNRSVDLLEETAIKNPFFKKSVNQQRQLVYGQ